MLNDMRSITCISCFSLLLICINYVSSQNNVGDHCTTTSGQAGVCKLVGDCPWAVNAIRMQMIFPKRCGLMGNIAIFCCIDNEHVPQHSNPPTFVPTRRAEHKPPSSKRPIIPTGKRKQITHPTVLRPGDKSKQKCREYAKFAIDSGALPPIVDDFDWSVDNCPITATTTISGGKISNPKEYPHMALVGFVEDNSNEIVWNCGGSLISERFILTAAHCVSSSRHGEPKYILLGDLDLKNDTDDARPQQLRISRIISHPNYAGHLSYHDIALIKMERNAILSPYVRPACLNSNPTIHNRNALISGWGRTNYFNGETSSILMYALIDIFSHNECTRIYHDSEKFPSGIQDNIQICAGSHNTIRDTCPGDSGGPLQLNNKDEVDCTYKIIGVTSFGKLCGTVGVPGVYTKVSPYIQWIESHVWP